MPDAACWPLGVDAWRCLTLGCRCLTLPVRWHLFPLRRGLAPPEPVSRAQLRRMFCYYDARFAHDMALVFHSANVAQRHAVNSAVAVKVQSRPDAFAEFNACVNDETFLRMLQRAKENPKGEEAREVMRKVVSFINCSASRVPWGMRERSAEVTNLIAGQRAHGAASVFYTCAPDDVHQPLAVRLSSAHKEYGVFPNAWTPSERCRKASSFLAALQRGPDKDRVRDDHHMDEGSLQKLAAVNPIASVLTFHQVNASLGLSIRPLPSPRPVPRLCLCLDPRLIPRLDQLVENVRVNLLGHSKERANNPPLPNACDDAEGGGDGACVRDHRKGIFGTNTLNRDVKECNKRAAMHEVSRCPRSPAFIALLWQRLPAVYYVTYSATPTVRLPPQHGQAHGGLSPALLGDVAAHDGLRQQALQALDSQVRGELPLEFHALRCVRILIFTPTPNPHPHPQPSPSSSILTLTFTPLCAGCCRMC